jgi:uncharacterized protein (DUF1800 family)
MDRRAFLTGWMQPNAATANYLSVQSSHDRTLSTGLEPWVPDPLKDPWDAVRAGHLLRRTMMMPKWSELTQIAAMTPSDAVDLLLNTPSNPIPPSIAGKVTHSLLGLDSPHTSEQKAEWVGDDETLKNWFAKVLLSSPLSIVEKMTFFWSGHFTSQFDASDSYVVAPLLYNQNVLFRNNALGNFHDLTMGVTLDGAMLVYLGGDVNSIANGKANENYSRELLELFTMGFGSGYTEGDVKVGAQILTGWHSAQFSDLRAPNGPLQTYFWPSDHDCESKTYLGVVFSAIDPLSADNSEDLVKKNEIQKMIDTIFDLNIKGHTVATYICRKIYRFFIYSNPAGVDENVVSAMAKILTDNNFDIKPVMSTLLKSAHFFDNANIGCQIKTPAEYIIGIARQLGYTANMADNMTTILQELFNPPNVSGWTGWHDWITTNTYPVRSTIAAAAIGGMTDQNVIDFINQFTDPTDANKLITELGALMLPRKLAPSILTPTRHDDLVTQLVGQNNPDYEWPNILSTDHGTAARNMRNVLTSITNLPDYQLC